MASPWDPFIVALKKSQRGKLKPPEVNRRSSGLDDFAAWAEGAGVVPGAGVDTLVAFEASLDYGGKRKESALTHAKALLELAAGASGGDGDVAVGAIAPSDNPISAVPNDDPNPPIPEAPSPPEDNDMPLVPKNENEEEIDNEEFDEEDENGDTAEPEPSPPRRAKAPPPQKVQVVMVPQPRRVGPPKGPPARARSSMLPRSEKVRIFTRGQHGKLEIVGDYTAEDVGGNLTTFIKTYIDNDYGDVSGRTVYKVFEVDAADNVKPPGVEIVVNGPPREQQSGPLDAISTLRNVKDLMDDLTADAREQASSQNDLMMEAKKKALASGDMSQMMMLMMMSNMMQPRHDSDGLVRAAEVIARQRTPETPPAAPPPPWMMSPPAAPPHNTMTDKLMEVAIASMLKPPKSMAEIAQEMAALKTVMNPSGDGEMAQLRGLVGQLAAKLDAMAKPAAPAGGLEAELASFERLTTVVKTLSPKIEGSFWSQVPAMVQAAATFVQNAQQAAAQQQAAGGAGATQQAKSMPQLPPAPQLPAPAAPPPPPRRVPTEAMLNEVKALRISQTRETRVEHTINLLMEMFNAPDWRPDLEPAMADLLQGKIEVPRKTLQALVLDIQAPETTPAFVDAVLVALILRAGGVPPQELFEHTEKKRVVEKDPTVDAAGNPLPQVPVGVVPVEVPKVVTPPVQQVIEPKATEPKVEVVKFEKVPAANGTPQQLEQVIEPPREAQPMPGNIA